MRANHICLLLTLAAAQWPFAAAAAPSAQARLEIARLIAMLGDSKCQFQRNGSWHDAAEARAHLQRKYDYLLQNDKVDTPEEFIERAASRSSLSGRPYRVRCGDNEQPASAWFSHQLKGLRNPAVPR
ncbi:MAG: DUF5329 domain-containing protein [Pseudoxanthomonas sp.]